MIDIYVRTGRPWYRNPEGGKNYYVFKYVLAMDDVYDGKEIWRTYWFDDDGFEETDGALDPNNNQAKMKFDFEMTGSYRKVTGEEMSKLDDFEIHVGDIWVRKDENPESAVYLKIIEISDKGVIIETYNIDLKSEGRITVDTKRVSIRKFIISNLYREFEESDRAKLLLEGKDFRI